MQNQVFKDCINWFYINGNIICCYGGHIIDVVKTALLTLLLIAILLKI